ncbi:MAG: transposase [Oscillospiraceae bacterium]|nr:transposase [Oscillospiraceae bacterium]
MQKELPKRKSIRLKNYDYSQSGAYFITVCVKGGHEMLARIVGAGFHPRPSVTLTDLGTEVQRAIKYINANTKNIEIPKYTIMPNHVHMIIALNTVEHIGECAVGHGSPTLQDVVGRIKSYTAKKWSEMCNTPHQTFWQRSFHDHIIHNEADYRRIWQYIDQNPSSWADDCYYRK